VKRKKKSAAFLKLLKKVIGQCKAFWCDYGKLMRVPKIPLFRKKFKEPGCK